jgi:hypothetical protein
MRRHLLGESEASDKAASYLGRIGQIYRRSSFCSLMKAVGIEQTDRRSSFCSLMKAVDKANDNAREKATKQQITRLHLSSVDSKPTGRATINKLLLLSREEGDEDTDSF